MRTFSDNAGRTWTVQVNVNAIKRVRDLAKVDLLQGGVGVGGDGVCGGGGGAYPVRRNLPPPKVHLTL